MSSVYVREVSKTFTDSLRETKVSLDVARAKAQHARYIAAIEAAGHQVIRIPKLDEAPDAVFVEDQAVVIADRALITRSGAPSRRVEADSVAEALSTACSIVRMEAPATLDGGDVLQIGSRVFVGKSKRTNADGVEALRSFAASAGREVIEVEVQDGLHLKSACCHVRGEDGGFLVYLKGRFDESSFVRAGVSLREVREEAGANILNLGARVLVSSAAPETFAMLGASRAVSVDVDEFHKADGALTCLSIWVERV